MDPSSRPGSYRFERVNDVARHGRDLPGLRRRLFPVPASRDPRPRVDEESPGPSRHVGRAQAPDPSPPADPPPPAGHDLVVSCR